MRSCRHRFVVDYGDGASGWFDPTAVIMVLLLGSFRRVRILVVGSQQHCFEHCRRNGVFVLIDVPLCGTVGGFWVPSPWSVTAGQARIGMGAKVHRYGINQQRLPKREMTLGKRSFVSVDLTQSPQQTLRHSSYHTASNNQEEETGPCSMAGQPTETKYILVPVAANAVTSLLLQKKRNVSAESVGTTA